MPGPTYETRAAIEDLLHIQRIAGQAVRDILLGESPSAIPGTFAALRAMLDRAEKSLKVA